MITKKCRVCGRDYTVCKNAVRNPNNKTFRWQEVACSPECGNKYFMQVEKSRNTQASILSNNEDNHITNTYDEELDENIVESLFEEPELNEVGDD